MSNKASTKIIYAPEPKPGSLKDWDVYTMCIGMVLGAGIITMLPTGITIGGARMGLVFPASVLLALLYTLPYVTIASAVRMGGGSVSLAGGLGSPVVAGMISMLNLLIPVSLGTYGLSMGNYVSAALPNVNGKAVAAIVIILFYVIGLFGENALAKIQNLMLPILMVGLAVFVIFGFMHLDFSLLSAKSNPTWAVGGGSGLFRGWAAMYSCTISYFMITYQGRLCKDARRQIPKAVKMTVATILPLYLLVGIVAIGVVPADQLNNTLVTVAKNIFPNWLYVVWIVLIPFLLIATTLNSLMASFSMMVNQLFVDGWLPSSLAKTNKRGVPYVALSIVAAIGVLPVLTGFNVVAALSTSTFCSFCGEVFLLALMTKFPEKYPEAFNNKTMRMPVWVFKTLCVTAIVFKGATAYSAFMNLNTTKMVVTICGVAFCLLWAVYRHKSGKAQIRVSLWDGTGPKAE